MLLVQLLDLGRTLEGGVKCSCSGLGAVVDEAEAYSATAARLNELDAACRGTPTTPSHAAVRRCTIAR